MVGDHDMDDAALRQLETGEILFRQGEKSERVAFVRKGGLEVVKELGSRQVVLGRVGDGEFAGEMGVLEGRPRNATVRALAPTTVEMLDRTTFLARIAGDRDLSLRVLSRLSERLRESDDRVAVLEGDRGIVVPEAEAAPLPDVTLFARSPELGSQIPDTGVRIKRFPFIVGRQPAADERAPASQVDLMIDDTRPYRLSRYHFAIQRREDGFLVADLESTLGTAVNGTFLGESFSSTRAELKPGENEIIAGGPQGGYRFSIVIA